VALWRRGAPAFAWVLPASVEGNGGRASEVAPAWAASVGAGARRVHKSPRVELCTSTVHMTPRVV
jgi:hypothetical protein